MSDQPSTDQQEAGGEFYRCPVPPDQSNARIKVGWRHVDACVQDASIDGFTVLVQSRFSQHLKVGKRWILEYKGARFAVHPQWFFQAPDGHVQMALRRIADLTELRPIGSWRAFLVRHRRFDQVGNSTLAYAGLILVLFLTLSLPGVGEKLGTSQRINQAFEAVIHSIDAQVSRWW